MSLDIIKKGWGGKGADPNPNLLRNVASLKLGPEKKFLGSVQRYKRKGGGLGNMDNVQTPAAFLTKGVNDNSVFSAAPGFAQVC